VVRGLVPIDVGVDLVAAVGDGQLQPFGAVLD
jgi:hypothetical protein